MAAQTDARAKAAAEVRIPMIFRGNEPAVEVYVNGKGPFTFAIDLGSSGKARVDTSLVNRLGLVKIGEAKAGDSSRVNGITMDVVQIDALRIGSLEFHNIQCPSRDYNRDASLPPIDGILTLGFFTDYLLTLDYPGKQVLFAQGELPAADGKEILEYDASGSNAMIDIRIGNQTIKTVIDTGNVGKLLMPSSYEGDLRLEGELKEAGAVRTINNTVKIREGRLKDDVVLGKYRMAGVTADFYDIFHFGNIGNQILSNFSLTFDQKNHRVRFSHEGATIEMKEETHH